MLALELARDDEARRAGVEGSDLATAILASVRLRREAIRSPGVTLTGDPSALEKRIARLLDPLANRPEDTRTCSRLVLSALVTSLLLSVALGSVFGERIVRTLLSIAA
jgi:hypothetical protein